MDNFNIGKGGEPPKKTGDGIQTPADRARKGLFSKKDKAPKPAKVKAQAAPAATQDGPAPKAAPAKRASDSVTSGAKQAGSNASKIILMAILGVTILGAAGFYVVNTFILNKDVVPQTAGTFTNRPVAGRPMPSPNAPVPAGVKPSPANPAPGNAVVPKAGEMPALPEKGNAPKIAEKPVVRKPAQGGMIPAPPVKKQSAPKAVKPQIAEKKPVAPPAVAKKVAVAKPVAAVPKAKPVVEAPKAVIEKNRPAPAVKAKASRVVVQPQAAVVSATPRKRVSQPVAANRAATVQISSLPAVSGDVRIHTPPQRGSKDGFYDWPGGSSKGNNKGLFDSQPSKLLKQEKEKAMDEFSSVKMLYMVLVKEADNPEELKSIGRRMPSVTPSPEIKQTESHGRQVYWLTVGHYTTADKAYNKAQELKSMGVDTTVVSEKIYY
ncbi:MAG: hypothetical protein WCX65_00650 [bacterium]